MKPNFLKVSERQTNEIKYQQISESLQEKLNGMTTAQVVEQGLLTISDAGNPIKVMSISWIDKATGEKKVSEPFRAINFDQGFIRLSKSLNEGELNEYYAKGTFGDLVFRLSEQPNKRGVLTKYFVLGKPGNSLKVETFAEDVYVAANTTPAGAEM